MRRHPGNVESGRETAFDSPSQLIHSCQARSALGRGHIKAGRGAVRDDNYLSVLTADALSCSKAISDDFNQNISRAMMKRKRTKVALRRHGWVPKHPVIGLQIPLVSSTEKGSSEISEWLSNLQEATGQGMLRFQF